MKNQGRESPLKTPLVLSQELSHNLLRLLRYPRIIAHAKQAGDQSLTLRDLGILIQKPLVLHQTLVRLLSRTIVIILDRV